MADEPDAPKSAKTQSPEAGTPARSGKSPADASPRRKPAARKTVAKSAASKSAAEKAPPEKSPSDKTKTPRAKAATSKTKAASKPRKQAAQPAEPSPVKRGPLRVVRTHAELNEATRPWRLAGETIALVPTMGALHAGHDALVERAKAAADHVVVSIFVNPTQFAPHEDLDRYPRNEAQDVTRLDKLGADLVWAPSVAEMYPDGFTTHVAPGSAAHGLESDFRPHFFSGVATVVAKLFNQVRPDFATFGEKDYQQLVVVTQLARDLDMGLEIVPVATVREPDGLALSSRNAYLSERSRAVAPNLNLVLTEVAHAAASGASIAHLKAAAQVRLLTLGFSRVDYVAICDAETLQPYDVDSGRPGRVLGAAWLGRTRLIDNVEIAL